MLFRKTVFALALAGAAIPAAFANSGSIWAGADGSVDYVASQRSFESTKSRADVQKELEAFRKNPVAADGGTWVSADGASYTFPQHSYGFQGGKLVHTDSLAHNTPKPKLSMTEAERRQFQQQLREVSGG